MKSDNRSSRDRVKSPQRQINLRNESEEKTCQWRKQMSYQGNADQPWTTQKPKKFKNVIQMQHQKQTVLQNFTILKMSQKASFVQSYHF